MNPCACGCGELTSGTWKRGHWARGEHGFDPAKHGPVEVPLPGPDDPVDLGELGPDTDGMPDGPYTLSPAEQEWLARHGGEAARAAANLEDFRPDEPEILELGPDPAPGPVRDKPAGKGSRRPVVRVTAATRKDIEAKFGLMLEVPGRVWAARDPYCGGTFVAQIPDIRAASVELICQSPDLVAWFTGVGGGFMLWLNLLTALQPVAMTAWAHHVAHAIEDPETGGGLADTAQYAA